MAFLGKVLAGFGPRCFGGARKEAVSCTVTPPA